MTGEIQADAAVLQERDSFTGAGWTKVVAPAKVNLHLAIGARRADGYHEAVSVMHALALHDIVYLRSLPADWSFGASDADADASDGAAAEAIDVRIRMVGCGDVEAPEVAPEKNIAVKAARAFLSAADGRLAVPCPAGIEIRIEKNIPAQAGLGGGSSDAAAVLAGLSRMLRADFSDEELAEIARTLGADVPFFLRGGCAYLDGAGDCFRHDLTARRDTVVLVKPEGGVSTAAAYAAFDEAPVPVEETLAGTVLAARDASAIGLFNNLAPAAESLMPELAEIRTWLESLPGVEAVLLSGSGSATFAVCRDFSAACQIAAQARTRGYWSRTTAFSSLRAAVC